MMQRDIGAVLAHIKAGIRRVENGENESGLLSEIQYDFIALIELLKLFLIAQRDNYYGYFAMNLQIKPDPYCSTLAGIRLDTFPPVLVANPLLLCKLSLKEIIFVFSHEIEHIILNHPAEMLKANPSRDKDIFKRFNLAADASVNERLCYEIQHQQEEVMAAPEGVITSKVLGKLFRIRKVQPLESYAYYYSLIRGKADESLANFLSQPARILSTFPIDDVQTQGEREGLSNTGMPITSRNWKKLKDHDWAVGSDPEEVTAQVREFVNAAVSMMNDEVRGLMPGEFMSRVEKLNEPPVLSWQSILKKYIGTISASKIKTRTRLNRRQPLRFDISGTMTDKVLKIVVAIDTSASINDKQISEIFREIFSILAKRKHEITVIECDAKVRRVYRVKTPSDIKRSVIGRGGTKFTPVIEYVNNDRYFRDALLVYFTDGFGELAIPKPHTYRNLWVILGDVGNLSLSEPYGTCVTLR